MAAHNSSASTLQFENLRYRAVSAHPQLSLLSYFCIMEGTLRRQRPTVAQRVPAFSYSECKSEIPSMRLLLIEDNEEFARLLIKGLNAVGFLVDLAKDACDATAALAKDQYAALLLDIDLHGENGMTFLRSLRADKKTLPVLILTARGGIMERSAGLRAGANGYLVKPFALDELVTRLETLFGEPQGFRRAAQPLA